MPPRTVGWADDGPAVDEEVTTTTEPDNRLAALLAFAVVVLATGAVAFVLVTDATGTALAGPDADEDRDRPVIGPSGGTVDIAVPAMLPGRTVSRCVVVDPSGAVGSEVRVYGASSGALVEHLSLGIAYGEPGGTCVAPGASTDVFVGRLGAFGDDVASAGRGHRTDGTEHSVPYLVDVTLDATAPGSAQGAGATLDMVWEVRPITAD